MEKKRKIVHVKRIDKEKKKTYKKEDPRKLLNTGRRVVEIVNFSNFKNKYMEGIDSTPIEYIDIMNSYIMTLYYHYKYDIYDTDNERAEALKKLLKVFDYNNYINIYVDSSEAKLKVLGIFDSMEYNIKKLYEVLHWLTIEMGIKVKMDKSLVQIRMSGWSFNPNRVKAINNTRLYCIREGAIIETSDDIITPRKELEGSTMMIEYKMNRFLNIPYLYYKRLYNIREYKMEYNIYSLPLEDFEYDPYEEREDVGALSYESYGDLRKIIIYNLMIERITGVFMDISNYGIGVHLGLNNIKHKIVTLDGKILTLTDDEFNKKYFKFLNW